MFRKTAISYARKNIKMRSVRKLSFHRQTVAYFLSEAANTIPHAAGNFELDVTPLIEYGQRVINGLDSLDRKMMPEELTLMAVHKNFSAFYLKTIAHVMHHIPIINTLFEWSPLRNGGRIYECEDILPSFTVHTKFGVVAPIIRNPHKKKLVDVANEMRMLARKSRRTDINKLYMQSARKFLGYGMRELDLSGFLAAWMYVKSFLGKKSYDTELKNNTSSQDRLTVEDVIGSTCTIANIGMSIDAHQTLTVIPPPTTFMWGIGETRLLPRVVNGQVVPRHIVTICISFDHRVMDGGDVFDIVKIMGQYINQPERIFEWNPGDPI